MDVHESKSGLELLVIRERIRIFNIVNWLWLVAHDLGLHNHFFFTFTVTATSTFALCTANNHRFRRDELQQGMKLGIRNAFVTFAVEITKPACMVVEAGRHSFRYCCVVTIS